MSMASPAPLSWPTRSGQINIDFAHGLWPAGSVAVTSDELVATLVFELIADQTGEITLAIDQPGNVFGVDDGEDSYVADIKETVTLGSAIVLNPIAVPLLGSLGGLVLAGFLGWIGWYGRRSSPFHRQHRPEPWPGPVFRRFPRGCPLQQR